MKALKIITTLVFVSMLYSCSFENPNVKVRMDIYKYKLESKRQKHQAQLDSIDAIRTINTTN